MSIQHPLTKGTKVKYLSPRCPCSGKRWELVEGVITGVNKRPSGNYFYSIRREKHRIPEKGIIEVLE